MYRGGPEDLDSLYPEELSQALGRLETVKEDASALRKGRRRLSNRDLARLAKMETEVASLEKRLALHSRRVRGAHLALAEALGRGWKEYLLGLGSLLFFLERTEEAMVSRRRMSADPGRSSKRIVKALDDALWLEMENARELASRISAPEGLDGTPAKDAKPLLIYLTRPAKRQRLLELARDIIDTLDKALTATLDLLLATEDRLREAVAASPEALKAFQSMPPRETPEIPELKDPKEGTLSPYVSPEDLDLPSPGDGGDEEGGDRQGVNEGRKDGDAEDGDEVRKGGDEGGEDDVPNAGVPDAGLARNYEAPGTASSLPAYSPAPADSPGAQLSRGAVGSLSPDDSSPSHASPPDASPAEASPSAGNQPSSAASAPAHAPSGGPEADASGGPESDASSGCQISPAVPSPPGFSGPPSPPCPPDSSPLDLPKAHEVTHTPQEIPEALRLTPSAAGGTGPPAAVPDAPARGWAPAPSKACAAEEPLPPSPARTPLRTLAFACVGLALALALAYAKKELFPDPKETSVYVFNGLGTSITVKLDGEAAFLAPGDRLEKRVSPGSEFAIEAATEAGTPVERLFAGAPRDGRSLVYSVAGAAPFVEWKANYGQEPEGDSEERVLGAPRLFTSRADYILSMPPGTLKLKGGRGTRLSLNPLSGTHPEIMLDILSPQARMRLIRTHARWEAPDQTFLPLWLAMAVAQDRDAAKTLLLERLLERPGDIWTLRELLRALNAEERLILCGDIRRDALKWPEDPGLAYLGSMCGANPAYSAEMLSGLAARFPDYPFVSRAMGMKAFSDGDTAAALELLRKAFAEDPRVMLMDMDLLARLSRLEGRTKAEILAEIGPWSPATRRLAEAEGPEPPHPRLSPAELSLRLLHLGKPSEALSASPEPFRREMLLWAAASDGAGKGLVDAWQESFAPDYLTPRTAWCYWALSVREGDDSAPAEGFILATAQDPAAARKAFLHILSRDWEALKDLSRGRDPRFQGQLALAASLVWKDEAPEEARHVAKSYLYIGERPYME
jgi:hypothetical protein